MQCDEQSVQCTSIKLERFIHFQNGCTEGPDVMFDSTTCSRKVIWTWRW